MKITVRLGRKTRYGLLDTPAGQVVGHDIADEIPGRKRIAASFRSLVCDRHSAMKSI
jgi:hypothetical protein